MNVGYKIKGYKLFKGIPENKKDLPYIMMIPHADDELIFLSSFCKYVSAITAVIIPDDFKRENAYKSYQWKDGRMPEKRDFLWGEKGLWDNYGYHRDMEAYIDTFFENFSGRVIIPGFNQLYQHPHHMQLENYMYDTWKHDGDMIYHLSLEENIEKLEMFKEVYPEWYDGDMGLVKSAFFRDYFISQVEVAKVFSINC
jgi:hypothetical protein